MFGIFKGLLNFLNPQVMTYNSLSRLVYYLVKRLDSGFKAFFEKLFQPTSLSKRDDFESYLRKKAFIPDEEKLKTVNRHPAGKLGNVEKIVAICACLAGDYAGFITGTTYLIDGGRSAVMQDDL